MLAGWRRKSGVAQSRDGGAPNEEFRHVVERPLQVGTERNVVVAGLAHTKRNLTHAAGVAAVQKKLVLRMLLLEGERW